MGQKKRAKKFFNPANFTESVPSKNPKHNKKEYYVRKKQYDERKIPIKYFAMGFIFVFTITGVVLLAIYLPDSINHGDRLYIEDGDTANVHYKLWIDDDRDIYIDIHEDPYQENTMDFIVSKENVITGFYKELLDLEIGEISRFGFGPNVDLDNNKIDDITKEEVLGYGYPSDHFLFNMSIYYWIQIINITKSEENLPASSLNNIELPVQMGNFSQIYLQCDVREHLFYEFLDNF